MRKFEAALLGFAVGALAGLTTGILLAPEKGKKTRDKLSYRLAKYRDAFAELLQSIGQKKATSDAKTEGERLVNDTAEQAEELFGEVDELLQKIKSHRKK